MELWFQFIRPSLLGYNLFPNMILFKRGCYCEIEYRFSWNRQILLIEMDQQTGGAFNEAFECKRRLEKY